MSDAHDVGPKVTIPFVVMLAVTGLALLLAYVDARHRQAELDGRPLAPHVLIVTPEPTPFPGGW